MNQPIAVDTRLSSRFVNLAEERLGAKVLAATDDFFAEKENLIKPGRGIFIPDKYTDRGKWMDGWESRRKRVPGHDHCTLRLGLPGRVRGFDIDTNYFLGNHPPQASVEAWNGEGDPGEDARWTEILPKSPLQPGAQNLFEIDSPSLWTHVRLHIYPDGGVARFRVYGDVAVDWAKKDSKALYDLAAVGNGGKVLTCNDMFFSSKDNLITPGRGVNMGDGWETKRKRGPGHDWVILELGHAGRLEKIEVDTAHFKGNYPDRCSLEGVIATRGLTREATRDQVLTGKELPWQPILAESKLQADHVHVFEREVLKHAPVSHLRFNIYPDGGVSRLRLWGRLA